MIKSSLIMPTFCIDCLFNSSAIPESSDTPRPPGHDGRSCRCHSNFIFDMEGAPCYPYDNRTISTFEENLCSNCIRMLPGESLPETFRLIRMGLLPNDLSRLRIRPVLQYHYDMMYHIEIGDRSIFVMGDGISLVPSQYWDGTSWNEVVNDESLIWTQEYCDICANELDRELTLNEIVVGIFTEFEAFTHLDCEICNYNSDGDIIFGDNGDEGWDRTMSGGEESEGECNNEIFSSDSSSDDFDSSSDSDY